MPENFRSSSDMATGSPLRRGRPPRTGARASRTIFLRRRFPVYLIDRPRRGRAARGTQPVTSGCAQRAVLVWYLPARRLTELLPGVQFSRDPEGARPVLPPDGPQHRTRRGAGEYGGGVGGIQQNRAGRSCHSFTERGAGLAHGYQEWRIFLDVAKRWQDLVNRRGGMSVSRVCRR